MFYVIFTMEGNNNQNESSSQIVQQLLSPPEIYHSNTETNPQNNSSARGDILSPNRHRGGRPHGSKNKPKPHDVINHERSDALKTHLLEISSGADIMETLNNYARQRGRGVCILNGKGKVSNVIIRQPKNTSSSLSGDVVTLLGTFEIISITGTILPPPAPPEFRGLSIFLSGGQGQVLGGTVIGPLIATGAVILTATSFANAVFERIPVVENQTVMQEDADNNANQVQQVRPVTSQASAVIISDGASLPLLNAGPANHAISGNLLGRGGSDDVAPRRPF